MKNCIINISEDDIEISEGIVENLTIADTDCVIIFHECEISNCTLDLSNYNGSEISYCKLQNKNNIDGTYIGNSLFLGNKSKYDNCSIREGDSIIYAGLFNECEIKMKKVFGGSFYLCELRNVLDKITIKDSILEECDLNNAILKGGSTYKECAFDECIVLNGNTFVGDNTYEDCEAIDTIIQNGDYTNTLFTECIIDDGDIKESRLDDCTVEGGSIKEYTIMEDGTTKGGFFDTVTFQNVTIDDGKFKKCVIYDDCTINGGDISEDSTVYADRK